METSGDSLDDDLELFAEFDDYGKVNSSAYLSFDHRFCSKILAWILCGSACNDGTIFLSLRGFRSRSPNLELQAFETLNSE